MASERDIDEVYELIDGLLRAGRFDTIDAILKSIRIDVLDTDLIITYLTVTFPACHVLPSRKEFFDKAKQVFIDRGEQDIEGLLYGLDSKGKLE
jgi:hypothetical protein